MGCPPTLEPVDDKDGDTDADTDVSAPDSGPDDTGLPPLVRCAVTEVEPNATTTDATALPREVRACGQFTDRFDVDTWAFEVVQEGWLGVEVDAYAIGSEADITVTLSSPGLGLTVVASSWGQLPDARLMLPAQPGPYFVSIRQEGSRQMGGEDYFYEVLASASKPPVETDIREAEPNPLGSPQVLGAARSVFGDVDASADEDWFALEVPVGLPTLRLAVVAEALGSQADMALVVRTVGGTELGRTSTAEAGSSIDPSISLPSVDAGTVLIGVIAEGRPTDVGAPYWYALSVSLEGTP
ncbi:MAG: hypothetical protein H6732_03175 [Alphaproteobacteria bacterium]|nr:hypothetical protein [Alphaproteobacteria bacterium]